MDNLTFDDILKNGPEWGKNLLLGLISQELMGNDKRLQALISKKISEYKNSKIEDLLTLLAYNSEKKGGKK